MPVSFPYLSPQQARGLACIVCSMPYDIPPDVPSVPVGVAAGTADQVFACAERCAPLIGYVPPAEQLEPGGAGR